MAFPKIGNPFSSMARKIQKAERMFGLEILDNGQAFNLDTFKVEGNFIYDRLKNKKYAYLDKTVEFNVNTKLLPGRYRLHLLDPPAATTIKLMKANNSDPNDCAVGLHASIEPDTSLYRMRGMASLIATVIDSNMVASNFKIKTEMGTLLLVAAFAFLIGAVMGIPFAGAL